MYKLNKGPINHDAIRAATRDLIKGLGYDPDIDELRGTPGRVARWWEEFLESNSNPDITTFELKGFDSMVMVAGINLVSVCEHHLLPFQCDATIAYIPKDGFVLGLSKLARIARSCAGHLNMQERLTQEIADEISYRADTPDVAVVLSGEHLCMKIRGVKSDHRFTTSVMRGVFIEHANPARLEFLHLLGDRKR